MAATVVVQVGQCGNQLGSSVFNTLLSNGADDPSNSSSRLFFHENEQSSCLHPRAVLIDLEPRVIDACLLTTEGCAYESDFCVRVDAGGSGNNWAAGFFKHGPTLKQAAMNNVRRQAERVDRLGSLFILHSAAGGTGSGLGSYLGEALRDTFPNAARLHGLVWPHGAGDVVVQTYNTIFTVAHLQQSANAMLWMHNDEAKKRIIAHRHHRPEMNELNEVLAQDMATALLLPTTNNTHSTTVEHKIREVVANPNYKCLEANSVTTTNSNKSTTAWNATVKQLAAQKKQQSKPRACIVTLRGRGAKAVAQQLPRGINTLYYYHETTSATTIQCAASLTNTIDKLALKSAIEKTSRMNVNNAYTHHYTEEGMEKHHIQSCLLQAQQICENY